MLKIILSGCGGKMGKVIARMVNECDDMEIVAGLDPVCNEKLAFPVFKDPAECDITGDVLIDFSVPKAIDGILAYCIKNKTAAVICTTGYIQEQLEKIASASYSIPILKSANMSIGVNIIADLVKKAAERLYEDWDIEIVEKHHNMKADAPSGTALLLADEMRTVMPDDTKYVYDRSANFGPRSDNEIGIVSVRGGTLPGEHEVIFAGDQEVIEIKHTAYSREIFASGAVKGARYIASVKKPGIYTMKDVLSL